MGTRTAAGGIGSLLEPRGWEPSVASACFVGPSLRWTRVVSVVIVVHRLQRVSFRSACRSATALSALSVAAWCVAWTLLSAPAQAQPSPGTRPPAAGTDTSAVADVDTVYVASGDVWAGTMAAQVRQRALFRVLTDDEAGAEAGQPSGAETGVSIGGLVINDTRTTIGRDFYDVFYSRWETPKGAENVMIRVYEQPRPNLGTRIVVDVEGKTIFRANLRPRLPQIKQAAQTALARCHRYVRNHYEPRDTY